MFVLPVICCWKQIKHCEWQIWMDFIRCSNIRWIQRMRLMCKPDNVHFIPLVHTWTNNVFLLSPIHNQVYLATFTWNYFVTQSSPYGSKEPIWPWHTIQDVSMYQLMGCTCINSDGGDRLTRPLKKNDGDISSRGEKWVMIQVQATLTIWILKYVYTMSHKVVMSVDTYYSLMCNVCLVS